MCSGHAFGVHWVDLEDQRRAGGMLLGCLGVPWRSLGVLWVSVGRSLEALGASWDRPGGPWDDFGGLGRSLDQSWEVRML